MGLAVGLKTLKSKLSEYVRIAARGETVLVTDRSRSEIRRDSRVRSSVPAAGPSAPGHRDRRHPP
ncbi:MAG: type II toxin-antitoxin system prevent-host-death family antitoxin [Candidatus Binatia bacterium]|nr:type II toxin-antitoxin system prevent-host-death family antitoxin [Candidatus Binatia bacterium]